MNKKLSSIYNFPSLNKIPDKIIEDWLSHGLEVGYRNKYPTVCKSTLLGIEVEVENLPTTWIPFNHVWSVTDDGSLRNNGREYISLPIRAKYVEKALVLLFKKLSPHNYSFSPRCSTHIHMNVRTLTPEQLKMLVVVYSLFEGNLFNFVGGNRSKNIHCVPLNETMLMHCLSLDWSYEYTFPNISWHKYTALNLKPTFDLEKGTVEFRHMVGTDDIKKLMTWINLILSLKLFVLKNTPEYIKSRIYELNSNSDYRGFALEVFGEFAFALDFDIRYNQPEMAQAVSNIKIGFASNRFVKELKARYRSKNVVLTTFDEFVGQLAQHQIDAPTHSINITPLTVEEL